MVDAAILRLSKWSHRARIASIHPTIRAAGISFCVRVFAAGFVILQSLLIARFLGPEGYGVFAVATSLSFLGGSCAALGLDRYSVFILGRSADGLSTACLQAYIRRAAMFVLIAAAGLSVLLGTSAFAAYHFKVQAVIQFSMAALLLPTVAFLLLGRGVSEGRGHFLSAQLPLDVVRPALVVLTLGGFAVFATDVTPTGLLLGYLCASAVAAGLAFGLAMRGSSQPRKGRSTPSLTMTSGLPFLGVSLLTLAMGELMPILVASFSDIHQTGLFAVAYRAASIMLIGISAISFLLGPRVSRHLAQDNQAALKRVTRHAGRAAFLYGAVIALGFWSFGEFLLSLFGPEFTAAYIGLCIMSAGHLVAMIFGPTNTLLVMSGAPAQMIRIQLIVLACGVLVAIALIPHVGMLGAAIAVATMFVLRAAFAWWVVRPRIGFDPGLYAGWGAS